MKTEVDADKLNDVLTWAAFLVGYIKATNRPNSMAYVYAGDVHEVISRLFRNDDGA
jgi:hypothetical protein